MRITHYENEKFAEELVNPEAFILLFQDANSETQYIFWGLDEDLKKLLIQGSIFWPLMPYKVDTREAISAGLSGFEKTEGFEYLSEKIKEMELFQKAFPDDKSATSIGLGTHIFDIEEPELSISVEGIDTYLAFAIKDGKELIGRNGLGSQKALMVYDAVESFFGHEARSLLEDIILGFDKELWYKFARGFNKGNDDIEIIE